MVHKYPDMRLDNQEFNFNFIENGENIIRCSNVEEAFFDIFNITLDEKTSFIKQAERYIDGCPIVKLNVEYGGTLYEDVEFKVVAAKGDKSSVFLNESSLENGSIFEPSKPKTETLEEQIELLAETIEATVELEDAPPDVDWQQLKQTSRQIHENKIALLIKQVEQQLSERIEESLHAARTSILAESINIQNKTQNDVGKKVEAFATNFEASIKQWERAAEAKISNYIINAINETRNAIEEQFEVVVQEQQQDSLDVLSEKIAIIAVESKQAISTQLQQIIDEQATLLKQTIADADESIKTFVEQKLDGFKSTIIERNTESFDAGVAGFINTQTQWLEQFVEGKIANVQQTLDAAQSTLEQKQDALAQKLTEHANEAVAGAAEKIIEDAKTLHQEQLQNVRQCVDDVIAEQIAALQPTTEIIVTEARNTQKNLFKDAIGSIKTEMSAEMKAHVANLQQDLYKKFAIYAQSYGGGGSVAAQFADGGTMNGTLNVSTGQILSAGIDLADLFAGGGSSGVRYLSSLSDVYVPAPVNGQTLTYNSSINKWAAGFSLSANNQTGYYGAFYDKRASQHDGGVIPTTLKIADVYETNGIALSSNHIIFNNAGTYEITYSIMFANSGNDQQDIYIWLKKNGQDIANSGSVFTITQKRNATDSSHLIAVTPVIFTLEASDAISICWHCASTDVAIVTLPPNLVPHTPDSPGVIVTAKQISNLETNAVTNGAYLPLSGGTVTGTTIFTGTLSATLIEAASANITVIDIKQYELSGFNVQGNASVQGTLSASGIVYALSGNSSNWNSVFATVQANSATTWNYQGSDVKALTANWQNTYSTVNAASSQWTQTLTFNESNATLSISNGNSVSLSALSGSPGLTGDYLPLSGGSLTGPLSTNQDIEITDATKGIILRSPGNVKYRVTVTDAGELVTTLV